MNHDLNYKDSYELYEIEADLFAAQLLMPEQVINVLHERDMKINAEQLQKWFGVTKQAAEKRIETLGKIDFTHRTSEEKTMDNHIILKFQNFIDDTAPISNFLNINDSCEYELQ